MIINTYFSDLRQTITSTMILSNKLSEESKKEQNEELIEDLKVLQFQMNKFNVNGSFALCNSIRFIYVIIQHLFFIWLVRYLIIK